MKYPGRVVFEFLEPIPAGLKRGEFMKVLEERIETASNALLTA
jgi:1-acyl-sn-glycerol-3-phosphate acyltransferase